MTGYLSDALTAAFPFLFAAGVLIAYCAVMFAGKWLWERLQGARR